MHERTKLRNVCIGIQARSNNTRLPGKVHRMLGGKTVLQHVIDVCDRSARYLVSNPRNGVQCNVVILCPYGDEIKRKYRTKAIVLEGPEHDVLERYRILAEKFNAEFVVRVTSDCPLLVDPMLTKLIKNAVMNDYDYYSNCDPEVRMTPDGYDLEIIKTSFLGTIHERAKEKKDREHVTLYVSRNVEKLIHEGFHIGTQLGHLDLAHLKISIDTEEDFRRVESYYSPTQEKLRRARDKFGHKRVHRF